MTQYERKLLLRFINLLSSSVAFSPASFHTPVFCIFCFSSLSRSLSLSLCRLSLQLHFSLFQILFLFFWEGTLHWTPPPADTLSLSLSCPFHVFLSVSPFFLRAE